MWRISVRKISSISVIWQVSALQFSSKSCFELAVSEEMTLSLYGFEKRKQKVSSAWRWTLFAMPVGGVFMPFYLCSATQIVRELSEDRSAWHESVTNGYLIILFFLLRCLFFFSQLKSVASFCTEIFCFSCWDSWILLVYSGRALVVVGINLTLCVRGFFSPVVH